MRILQKIFPKKFDKFFKKIKSSKNLDEKLIKVSESFINSDSYTFVSNHWHIRNITDYTNISNSGLDNLGVETFGHYFNLFDYENAYLENLFNQFKKNDSIQINSNFLKKHKDLDLKQCINYNYLLLSLYSILKKSNYFKYLPLLKDETYLNYGNPFITIDNHNVTSDKLVSLFDLEKIDEFNNVDKANILEIGAGSGRLSEAILAVKNISNYTICDIPPSIYISYKRLKLAFPQKKIEFLIDEKNPENLNKEIMNNDITFIFPHQIKQLKKKTFNLTIAIDCLHEMDKSTIDYYFKNISNVSRGLYFSIWQKTKNWDSGGIFKRTERLDFDKGDYPIPKNWEAKYRKNLVFPSNQIGLGYTFD